MESYKELGATGLVGLLATIVTYLFARRGSSHVRHANAQDERESRFQDNLQKRYDAAMGRNSELQAELQEARDGKRLLERKLRERERVIVILHDKLEQRDPAAAADVAQWIQPSEMAPFDDIPRPSVPGGRRDRRNT